jgi:hypothetical protein
VRTKRLGEVAFREMESIDCRGGWRRVVEFSQSCPRVAKCPGEGKKARVSRTCRSSLAPFKSLRPSTIRASSSSSSSSYLIGLAIE